MKSSARMDCSPKSHLPESTLIEFDDFPFEFLSVLAG